jgi:hypothetical protein
MKALTCILGLSIFFVSCQKVVNLKLNTSSSQIVIVGKISNQTGVDTVSISKSVNFSDPNVFPQVSGAKVYLSDNAGNKDTLKELKAGSYITKPTFKGIAGRTYTVTVIVDGQTYVANSTIPQPVAIDSVYIGTDINGGFGGARGNKEKTINVVFKDPVDILNFYQMVDFINGVQQNTNIINDHLLDGQSIARSIREKNIVVGDSITIALQCIDNGVYEYFRTAGRDNLESSMPANPVSNFNNNALGYFNAYSVTRKSIVVSK